jgi:YbbR domain-containing protein
VSLQRHKRIVRSLSRHWPQKITALAIATFLWLFVSTEQITTSQRSFLVLLTVVGLSDNQLATGVPEFIEVSVSGESTRIDALRAENIETILDLSNVRQDFARPVRVSPPQGITLLRRNPSEVIGTVETRASRTIAVSSTFLRAPPNTLSANTSTNNTTDNAADVTDNTSNPLFQDVQYQAQIDPSQVTITGRSQQVDQVVQAIVPINLEQLEVSNPTENADTTNTSDNALDNTPDTSGDDAANNNDAPLVLSIDLYAVDANGEPVRGVTLDPASVQVRLQPNPILHTKRVPLEVILPTLPDFVVENRQLTQTNLLVAGSHTALSALERVVASVSFETPLREGEHTATVTPQLPEGLVALESAELRLRLSRLRDFPAPPPS